MGGFAWVTLATNDSYSLGALVLAHSLRRVGTKYDLAVLVTPGVTGAMREKLSSVFSLVQEVNVLDSKDEANLALLARPELGITFTKLHCWRLTQYEKCVFVDADTLVIRNCDELFERDEFSAAPDVGWPDCFNSGVFVFKPSQETFASITSFAAAKGSFDGGDQGLLNQYFSDWSHKDISKHLPFIYNMCSTATYSYLPAFKQFGEDVRIIHFIGITKPWLQYFDTVTGQVQSTPGSHHLQPLLQLWWNIFCENVHPKLSPEMASSTLARHWHEYLPYPALYDDSIQFSLDCSETNHSVYQNYEPDFSEFKDPWENHTERSTPVYDRPPNVIDDNDHGDNHNYNIDQKFPDKSDSETSVYHELTKEEFSLQSRTSNRHCYGDNETPTVFKNNESQKMQEDNCEFYTREIHHLRINPKDLDSRVHEDSLDSRVVNTRTSNRESCSICEIENHENSKSIELVKIFEHGNDVFDVERRQNPLTVHRDKDPRHYCSGHDSKRQSDDDVNFRDQISIESNFDRDNEENRLKDRCISDIPQGQTDFSNITLISHPLLLTMSKNVTSHSETNITRQRESNDAGIAGALAKITLGEGRSPEQVALEEHMRKQSWEQGQIDYMGRDSFDNIWKKITETLGVPPKQQPSPPKTQPEPEKARLEEPTVLPTVDQPTAKSEAAMPSETQRKDEPSVIGEVSREIRKLVEPLSELMPEETSESTVSLRPSSSDAAIEEKIPTLPSPESFEKSSDIGKIESITESKSIVEDSTKMAPSCEIRKETGGGTVMDTRNVTDSQKDLEIVAESQVPIQVAESVLEADVKESVSEDLKPVTEEAISTISLTAQESVPAVLETAMEASGPIAPISNGSADLRSNIGNGIDALSDKTASATVAAFEGSLDSTPSARTQNSPSPAPAGDSTIQEDVISPLVAASVVEEREIASETATPAVTIPEKEVSEVPAKIQSSSSVLEPAETSESPAEAQRALPPAVESTETPGGVEKSSASLSASNLSSQRKIEQSPDEKPEVPLGQSDSHAGSATLSAISRAPETPESAPSPANLPKESAVPEIHPTTVTASDKSKLETCAVGEKKVVSPASPAMETKVPVSCPAKSTKKIEDLAIKFKKPAVPQAASSTDDTTVEASTPKAESTEKTSQPESREKSPVRPARTKEIEIPGTPTVTEPTPPTSPPIGGAESVQEPATKVTKKVVKKVMKKTSETKPVEGNDPDSDGKKITKKVVKKVVKKKEDDGNGGESTSGNEKPKKIVKVVKKTTKAPQTLDAEATVPETPPPGTPEVPVPPKRKLKATTKSTSGKSDSEP